MYNRPAFQQKTCLFYITLNSDPELSRSRLRLRVLGMDQSESTRKLPCFPNEAAIPQYATKRCRYIQKFRVNLYQIKQWVSEKYLTGYYQSCKYLTVFKRMFLFKNVRIRSGDIGLVPHFSCSSSHCARVRVQSSSGKTRNLRIGGQSCCSIALCCT